MAQEKTRAEIDREAFEKVVALGQTTRIDLLELSLKLRQVEALERIARTLDGQAGERYTLFDLVSDLVQQGVGR